MALNELSLSITRGVRGRPFQAEIEGLTTGWVEVVSDKGAPGFAVINGRVRHEALPYQPSTVVLRERAPGQAPRLSRIEISASEPWEIQAQAAGMIGEGRTLRRLLVTSVLDAGNLVWHVLAEDDLGDTEWEEVGEPEPSAPVFASEPGTLDDITDTDVLNLGFTNATGYPSPTYVLDVDPTLPDDVAVYVGDAAVELPFAVPSALVDTISVQALAPMTETFDLTLTATNGVSPDAVATAAVSIDIAVPAPEWSVESYAVELPISAPITFGSNLSVENSATIRVAGLPDKGVYYIDDGDDTPLALNDEFAVADLALLTGESDGDTGAVTGVLKLRALGSSNVDLDITVTIAAAAGPDITDRDFDIEEGTEANIGFDTATMGDSELASIDNQTTGGSAVIVKIPDLS